MLELLKRSERTIKVKSFLSTMRDIGNKTREIEEFIKWKELSDGSRIAVSITVYEIIVDQSKFGGNGIAKMYCMKDTLGMEMQKSFATDMNEIERWLKEKGYKTAKRFYIEDYGMTEETWEEWNK